MIRKLFKRKNDDLTPIGRYCDYEWCRKVIRSCITPQQLLNARRLVHLFYVKHEDVDLYKRLDKETDYRLEEIIKLLKHK